MKTRETITYEEALARFERQGVDREHRAVICPMCGTVQSREDLIRAGAGDDMEAVEA